MVGESKYLNGDSSDLDFVEQYPISNHHFLLVNKMVDKIFDASQDIPRPEGWLPRPKHLETLMAFCPKRCAKWACHLGALDGGIGIDGADKSHFDFRNK